MKTGFRERFTPSGIEVSWPLFASRMATLTPAHRKAAASSSLAMIAIPFLFIGMCVFLASSLSGGFDCSVPEHRFTSPPGWQYVWSTRLVFGGLMWIMCVVAFFIWWMRFSRFQLRFGPGCLRARVKWLGLGPSWKIDPQSNQLMQASSNGTPYLSLRSEGGCLALGAGLGPQELNRIEQLSAETQSLRAQPLGSCAPPRFEVSSGDEGHTVTIGCIQNGFPKRFFPTVIVLMMGPMIASICGGFALASSASKHDPAVIDQQSRAATIRPHQKHEDKVGDLLLLLLLPFALVTMIKHSGLMLARRRISITPTAITLQSGGRRTRAQRFLRADVTRIRLGKSSNALANTIFDIEHRGKQIRIHPGLTRDEADWLVEWIRKSWPEIEKPL